jgi:hypothetical protein
MCLRVEVEVGSKFCSEAELLRREAFLGIDAIENSRDEFDENSVHVIFWSNSLPIAAARIVLPPKRVFLTWSRGEIRLPNDIYTADVSRVCVSKKFIRYGLAKILIVVTILNAHKLGYQRVAGTAESGGPMEAFLLKLGFVVTGPPVTSYEPHLPPLDVVPMLLHIEQHLLAMDEVYKSELTRLEKRGLMFIDIDKHWLA